MPSTRGGFKNNATTLGDGEDLEVGVVDNGFVLVAVGKGGYHLNGRYAGVAGKMADIPGGVSTKAKNDGF